MNVLIVFFLLQTLIYSEGNDTFPNCTFTLKKFKLQGEKKVEHCIVIASIVKNISCHDFEELLAKIGHGKGKSV